MIDETDQYFKVVSLLLQYPDEAYFGVLPEIKAIVGHMRHEQLRAAIEEFIADLEAGDAICAQERYTALFDMSPSTTLNVTYHLWGDGEKRARLLCQLQQAYAGAGLEKDTPELPDFLPLILEFMASFPEAKRSEAVKKSLEGIGTLAARLQPVAAHYSRLIKPLAEIYAEQGQEQTAAGATET